MNAPMMLDTFVPTQRPHDAERGYGALRTAAGNLPMVALSVRARIVGLSAELTLEQSFYNAHHEPLEATYIFPLPDRAAVSRFVMDVAGRKVEGVLKERGEARAEFDQAIKTGFRAAIAEEERPGVFTMRAGNLLPGEVAQVTLEMVMPLVFEDDEATFRFPLVVAPRYVPGAALGGPQAGSGVAADTTAVPDASRISPPVLLPGCTSPVRLAMSVEVDAAGLPLEHISSSLHAAYTHGTLSAESPFTVALYPGERLDRDFILRLRFRSLETATAAVLSRGAGDNGCFAVTLMPPTHLATLAQPRDVIFLLDQSGSMGGWKMVAARRAVARMVDTLTHRDRFNVYAFDDRVTTPHAFGSQALVDATDRNRYAAIEFLAKIEARGGTELMQPLTRSTTSLRQMAEGRPGRDAVVVLVTDGQVGNEDQILEQLASRGHGVRIFSVGIDRAVNEGFLRRLAMSSGGALELVEGEARLDDAMDRIHRKLGTPLLRDLQVSGEGLTLHHESFTPERVAALFAGTPLELFGRFTASGDLARAAIVVRGTDAVGRPFEQRLTPRLTSAASVEKLWARGRVRALEDKYAAGTGDMGRLERELIAVSLGHGVLCRFTSFVAVDRAEVVNAGGNQRHVTQAVEAASGWGMLGKHDAQQGAQASVRSRGAMRAESAAAPGAMPAPPPAPMAAAPMAKLAESAAADAFDAEEEVAAPAAIEPQDLAKKAKREQVKASPLPRLTQAAMPQPMRPRAPTTTTVDLTAYVARATALSLEITSWLQGNRETASLTLLLVRIRALVEDLRSLGLDTAEANALQAAFDGLERALGSHHDAASATLDAAWTKLSAALQAMSLGATAPIGAPTASSTGAFWKRH